MVSVATSSAQRSLSAIKNTRNMQGNFRKPNAEILAFVSMEQPIVLADVNLGAVVAEISKIHICSKAKSLRVEVEAQEAIDSPHIRCVTECGTPIGYYRQNSTHEQSTALSRSRENSVQAEHEHPNLVVSNFTAASEGFPRRCELAYNWRNLIDERRSNDLRSEIAFLRRSLCSLLLQPMAELGSREQIRPPVADALRGRETDLNAAEVEEEEQIAHEQTNSDPGLSEFPMTAGHLEIKAVNEAVKEISNALLSLKDLIKDLPSQFSQDHQTILHNNLERVCRDALRFPDCLTSLLVRRTAELDATRKDRDAAAETLRAAKEKMAAAEAKQMDLMTKTRAFERGKNAADEKVKGAAELSRAVETREKLVAGRERRVVRLEEEQALNDLNRGANAAMEDGIEAAAAEAREDGHSTSPSIRLAAAGENEWFPAGPEKISNAHPARGHVFLGRDTAVAAKEEELWHRENNLAFRETNLHHRETALFAREQLLEHMKTAQIQLAENWKAQIETSYAGLEANGEDVRAKFGALIALKGRVEEMQAKVRGLIGEARKLIGRCGEDAGEDGSA